MPRATYRVQLQPGFGFDEAGALADYLSVLGVSHVYTSPYLQAAAGSTHGYDVVDPTRINTELGGPVGHQHFGALLGDHGLGQVLDIVPNHMAVSGADNPYWWDVIENGQSSIYARFFDIEWSSADPGERDSVLIPVLGDHYGKVLEAGDIQLERDRGSFRLRYGNRIFPVAPGSLGAMLAAAGREAGTEELVMIGESFASLPVAPASDREAQVRRHRAKEVLKLQLARLTSERPEVEVAVDREVEETNADVDRLDALIQGQHYRLAFWRAAREDLDYRRFFDVTNLAGLRMEDPRVFEETHQLILGWLREGVLDGVRIDHPDGLRDPKSYFDRIHRAAPDAWVVAEKILEPGEDLPPDWPIAGTTGYDFLNLVNRLYTDPRGEQPLTDLYAHVTGETRAFAEIAYESKRYVIGEVLAAEINRLTEYLAAVVRGHRRQRDYSRGQLRAALRELIACFPVYRTYVRPDTGAVSHADQQAVEHASRTALEHRPDLPADLIVFIADVLLARATGERESEFLARFQQLTGPVMAKGVEDTAFYRYMRLTSANEVGGDPGLFSTTLLDFHAANEAAANAWPARMLASSTHDTKRSEDVRARITLLSEMGERWQSEVAAWRELASSHRSATVTGNAEYMVYQTLVGTWPITAERLALYVEKAAREEKLHTSWTDSNEPYEAALRSFVDALLADETFTDRVAAFVDELAPTWQISALAQTLLKLTAPGVPDIYQGTEIWDLSLVDPDNRRAVDFAERRRLLDLARSATAADALAGLGSGLAKMWLIRNVLGIRRDRPSLFGVTAGYAGLMASGARKDHVVAYRRGEDAVVIAPRLVSRVGWPASDWGDTSLELPRGDWADQLGGQRLGGGNVAVAELLREFPMALLTRSE